MFAKRFCLVCARNAQKRTDKHTYSKYYSTSNLTNSEIRQKRNARFTEEKETQLGYIRRLEKIRVTFNWPEEADKDPVELVMNKHVSTPYNCAMHISEYIMQKSVVALVDGEPWDMHLPLDRDCEISFQHMLSEPTTLPNETFFRSGAFILGYIIEQAFKDDIRVNLCGPAHTEIEDGCFIYDVDLGMPDWKPTQMELNCLSRVGGGLWTKDLEFEKINVNLNVAREIFEDSEFKLASLDMVEESSPSTLVSVYRVGDHVDLFEGPLISNTAQLNRFSVTAVHQVNSPMFGKKVYRFQGIAVPNDLKMHYWSWELLCKRAAKPNTTAVSGYFPTIKPKEAESEDLMSYFKKKVAK